MSLEALGWNARWQEKFEAHAGEGLVPARVVGEHRSHYGSPLKRQNFPQAQPGECVIRRASVQTCRALETS